MSIHNKIAATPVRRAVLGALLALGAAPAFADPADHVFVPYAVAGKWELAYDVGTEHARDGSRETQQVLSVGGTPTARWYTSVYAAWAASGGGAWSPDEWSWVNHVQLTTPGAGPVDVGARCELARPHDRDEGRFAFACGPTLQMDTDDVQVNVNLSLGKHVGGEQAEKLGLGYQWQVKAMVAHDIELGLQGFGSFGPWNDWSPASEQEHTVGPAIFVKTSAFGGPIRIDAAWLFGIGDASPRNTIRLRVEHEF